MRSVADQLTELINRYGPSVTDAALGAVRTEGFANLFVGFVLATVTAACAWGIRKLANKEDEVDRERAIVTILILACVGIVFGFFALFVFLDVWNWVMLFRPEYYVAKQLMGGFK